MRLISPGDIRRGHQGNRSGAMARGGHEFIDGPIFQHKAQQKHDPAKNIIDQLRGRIPDSHLCVEPFQEAHGYIVDRP